MGEDGVFVESQFVGHFFDDAGPFEEPSLRIGDVTRSSQPPSIETNQPKTKRFRHFIVQGDEVSNAPQSKVDDDRSARRTSYVGKRDD